MRSWLANLGLVMILAGCAAITDVSIAPADTSGQQVYRAAAVVEAAANWVQVYVVQAKADPITIASLVDSVRVAHAATEDARRAMGQGADTGRALSIVGEAVLGLVLVAESAEGISVPAANGNVVVDLVDDATTRMQRLGAARARLADLRSRLGIMTAAHRDPTAAEWSAQDAATGVAYAAMLQAAHLPPE